MEGRLTKKTMKKVCGLWSLPDDVILNCLAPVSRLDLAAVAMTSKELRFHVAQRGLCDLRFQIGCVEACLYVCLHIVTEPTPRWFILHPVQRRLKPICPHLYQYPDSSFSFVKMHYGIFIIGGLVNGKPICDVSFFDCFEHKWHCIRPMKMARASASASLIDMKIYVFGGCGDEADSSNWAEVFDFNTGTWEFLFVPLPRPKKIQQSVVINNEVYAIDEDSQILSFSPSKATFMSGKTDFKAGSRDDWCLIGGILFCRGTRGRILWCLPHELDWKQVMGLEELQHCLPSEKELEEVEHGTKVDYDISKLSRNSAGNIVIFSYAQRQGPESLELWSAEISLEHTEFEISEGLEVSKGVEVRGKIEWSGAVYKLDPFASVKILFAGSVDG
ncbi:hypothetical protein AALP_AA6G267600 [Arabis alpina]|uniref:F-box domain-containing protein n=1 Tax=Arabis alpina TaxID=50452 RepID=A0A087GRX1_ARAAL|nr:hypothetical protein AALP_AA6G267600 [Arabis alpina]